MRVADNRGQAPDDGSGGVTRPRESGRWALCCQKASDSTAHQLTTLALHLAPGPAGLGRHVFSCGLRASVTARPTCEAAGHQPGCVLTWAVRTR